MKITESTTVQDALKKSKDVIDVFRKYNLDCPGCRGSGQDTIGIVAENNGIDLAVFLRELNAGMKK
jgi:hybrid cluster-associated redox disulfide protein